MNAQRVRQLAAGVCLLIFFGLGTNDTCQATDLSGCWSGRWYSCTTGHEGPLRGSFCKINDTQYSATFRGRFWKVFPFRFSVVLNVVEDDGETVTLQGSTYLGRMFGTFHYNATATANTFRASYSSKKDYGTWVMSR